MALGQLSVVLVGIWWYWVSRRRYWLALSGTESVWGVTGWFLLILGQFVAVLVGTWWYWVSLERNWLIHDGAG